MPFVPLVSRAAFDDLADVDLSDAVEGMVPTFDGETWVAAAPAAGGPEVFVSWNQQHQQVVSSAALVATNYQLPVEVGSAYALEGMLRVDGNAGGDIKLSIVNSGGGSLVGEWLFLGPDAASAVPGSRFFGSGVGGVQPLGGAAVVVGLETGAAGIVIVKGWFANAGAAESELTLQFAQNASNINPTKILGGSWLKSTYAGVYVPA